MRGGVSVEVYPARDYGSGLVGEQSQSPSASFYRPISTFPVSMPSAAKEKVKNPEE